MATYPPTLVNLPEIFNPDEFYQEETGVGTLAEVLAAGNNGANLGIVSGGAIGCSSITTPFGFIDALETTTITDIATTGVAITPTGTLKIKGAITKGSLLVGDGTNTIELPTATNGLVLKTNSGTASGLQWEADGLGVSSITAGDNISVDPTIPSAPVVSFRNPFNADVQLGTRFIEGSSGYINFATASPSSEAQMSASIGFTAYDSITTGIATTLQKTGLTTQTTTDNINFTPIGITKSVGATTLGITSNTSNITLTPQTAKDCDVVVSGAGKLHIQQSTTGGQANPLCRLSNTNATGSVAMEVYKNKPTAVANGDVLFNQSVYGNDSGLAKQEYTRITHTIRDGTAGGEDGSIEMSCFVAGAVSTFLQLNGVENEVNCLKVLDMGGNSIRTNTGDLNISALISSGTGNITLNPKATGVCNMNGNFRIPSTSDNLIIGTAGTGFSGLMAAQGTNYTDTTGSRFSQLTYDGVRLAQGTLYAEEKTNIQTYQEITITDTTNPAENLTTNLTTNGLGLVRTNTGSGNQQQFYFNNDSATGGVIDYANTIGSNGILMRSNQSITFESTTGLFFLTNLPTSIGGLPTGALWNNGGVLSVV